MPPRLRRVDPAGPGITRRRAGRGFTYRTSSGEKVSDAAVLERIRGLAIPPAWDQVWICPDYVAKGGKRRVQSVVDPGVFTVVAELKRRRGGGPELLAWRRGRTWIDVKSADINTYIKEVTGGDFSAKDFRTWNATVLAAVALGVSTEAQTKTARQRAVVRAREPPHPRVGGDGHA